MKRVSLLITFKDRRHHFLYADVLVIFSLSEDGLQRGLDKLQHFTDKTHLTVRMVKSKTTIFNNGTGKRIFNIAGIKVWL